MISSAVYVFLFTQIHHYQAAEQPPPFQRPMPEPRQSIDSPDLFSFHPPTITDGFTLHIKSCLLIGKVARFNSRFLRSIVRNATKEKQRMREMGVAPGSTGEYGVGNGYYDPRGQEQFLELENHLRIFQTSLFPTYKDYIHAVRRLSPGAPDRYGDDGDGHSEDRVSTVTYEIDANLYSAHIIPHA